MRVAAPSAQSIPARLVSRLAGPVFLVVLAWIAAACSEERAPINQVQPNTVSKAFFVGDIDDYSDDPEFYMRNTVVDVAAGAGADGLFVASDAQPVTRIRFEITEKLLIARLTYELVDDTDGKGRRRTPDGQPVAAFAIEKHFDIRRDYNPTTGEESNVIVENDTDRPWQDREYMRVDWSRNLITDAYDLDALSQLGIYYAVTWDPVAYTVDDPQNPDAPVFDAERGYFDVTHKALASPEVIHDEEWGDFPACWLIGYFPTVSCNPSEITLRQSFLKVTDTDYEPMAIDGTMMDQFGYFTWDRFGWDRRYGVVDDLWRRYATKWNLYERSHADPVVECNTVETTPIGASPHRDDNHDGTEDECASVGRGSRCDDVVGECTIPLRDREVRTIAWHVNDGSPEDLFEGSAAALESWNQAMRVAVQAGRYAECKRTLGAACEAEIGFPQPFYGDYPVTKGEGPAAVPDIFVLCHNPVVEGDHEACGPQGTAPRLGDLRYNILNIVTDVEGMAPWGIMVDAEDPLTGEKISGSVNEWGYVLDRAASNLVDILALLNGEIAPDQFISGENVASWLDQNRVGGPVDSGQKVSAEELAQRRDAYDPEVIAPYFANTGKVREGTPAPARHAARLEALTEGGRLGPGNAALGERLKRLRGTALEGQLASPEMRQAVGFDPTSVPTDEQVRRASPFGRMNPTIRRDEQQRRRMGVAAKHSCRLEGPDDDYLIGLAREAQALFPAPNSGDQAAVLQHRTDVWNWARQKTSAGVMAHELGHSMGLRHNFAASFDALNYHTPYWQLRTKNGTVTKECEEGESSGEDCIGPRYKDPLTATERDLNISHYSTTSVMDYPGDQNQDMLLVGSYDRAAVRFGYGGTVDVWGDPGINVDSSDADAQQRGFDASAFTVSPGLFGVQYFPKVGAVAPYYTFRHYSTYQRDFNVLGTCSAPTDASNPLSATCTGAPMDVVDYRDMGDFVSDPDYAQFSWGRNAKARDAQGRIRRGYMFSSDEYADSGNVPSFTDDAGADAYEQIRFLESAFENRYIFDSFRRNRVQFNSWDVTARVQSRYLDAIQLITKAFLFGAVLDGDPTQPTEEFLADGQYGPLQMGSTYALDMFARILTRPDPGYYCEAEYCGGVQPWGVDEQVYSADPAPLPNHPEYYYFQVPLGEGRYLHNDFDYSQGYFWGDYQTQTGSYYDKVWAVYYLAEAFDSFISNSREDFVDSRYKNVNFATVYPKQIDRLFSGLLTSDYQTYAPWVQTDVEVGSVKRAKIHYPRWSSLDDPGRPSGDDVFLIDPDYGWNTQIYAMVWGSMFFPTNWSNQWIDQARIAVLATDEPQWPEDETVRFVDPATGMTYRAHDGGEQEVLGQTRRTGVGARALQWANTLEAWAYVVEVDDDGIPLYNEDGTPQLVLDDDGKPQLDPDYADANAELRRYVDTIDLFRQLVATFEQPIDELPEP